jgi:hypothetical protein
MPTQIQWRRGNTAQTAAFTGALAEITVDTDKKTLVVHDGVTAGGFSLALESAQQDALAYAKANGAYDKANTANVIAQGAFNKVNVAFDVANTKFSASGGTISGDVSVTGNVTPVTDNTKYLGSPSYRWHTLYVGPGSIDIDGIKIQNTAGKLVVTGATDFTVPGAPSTGAISAHANAAFNAANTGLVAPAAFAQANAAFSKANSAYDQAIIGTDIAGLAFTQANSGTGIATSGFAQANLAYTRANAAYELANNVAPQVQPAFGTANSAFGQANLAFSKANSAYDLASNVAPQVQPAFNTANLAYTQANTATVLAQDAYDRANTKVSSSGGTITGPVTINSDLTVTGNVSYTGNVTSVQITGNTGQFFGDAANGFQALYAGIPTGYTFQEQTVIQSTGSYDGFVQINVQNIDPGFNSSTDFVATNDNTAGDAYIDVGINSTTYNNPTYGLQHAGDGYVYVSANTTTGGGNLVFSTTASGRDIIFSTGGTLHENEVARFQDGVGLVMQGKPIKFADATTQNTAAVSTAYSAGIYNTANSGLGIATSAFAQANLAYDQANSAYTLANNVAPQVQPAFDKANGAFDIANSAAYAANTKVTKAGDSMTGTLTLPTLAANTAVTINSVGTIVATTLTTTSNAQVTLDQFSNTAFRSARYQVQMENGLSYHSTEIGLIHDGSTAYINQYGDLMTNISLGTFDTTITLGQVKLLFTPANSTNTVVNAVRTAMPYANTIPSTPAPTNIITGSLTVGNNGSTYGKIPGGVGTMTTNPTGIIPYVNYNGSTTVMGMQNGTYSGPAGSVVYNGATLNGSSTFTMTIDGLSAQWQFGMMGLELVAGPGNPYQLDTKNGQTLSVSVVIP